MVLSVVKIGGNQSLWKGYKWEGESMEKVWKCIIIGYKEDTCEKGQVWSKYENVWIIRTRCYRRWMDCTRHKKREGGTLSHSRD